MYLRLDEILTIISTPCSRLLDVISEAGERMARNPAFIVFARNFALGSLKVNTSKAGDLIASVAEGQNSGSRESSPDSQFQLTVKEVTLKTNPKNKVDQGNEIDENSREAVVSISIPSSITKSISSEKDLNFVTVVYKNGNMLTESKHENKGIYKSHCLVTKISKLILKKQAHLKSDGLKMYIKLLPINPIIPKKRNYRF